MFLGVSAGRWTLSARALIGAEAETLTDWLVDVMTPRGDGYTFLPAVTPSSVSLPFVAFTSSVLLDRPLPPAAVRSFETSLADALKPLLGDPAFLRPCGI